jgi:small-conductance mechanosensitive channel
LSMVAYFFLIGRYGIRVGDRVTISGVTGDVLDIGLVRLSMMELGADMHSTGRLVVYSNAVIFQPAAFFKQIPGINYVWHQVSLTLSTDSDFQIAEKKLNEAVDSIYQRYRAEIEQQHALFEQSVDVETNTPKPESRLRFSDTGLLFTVRYPAEMKDAATTDDQVMKALWDAIEKEPKLKFASAGTPKLQAVS